MDCPPFASRRPKPGKPGFQFSLRIVFVAMTAMAVALAGIYAAPPLSSILTAQVFNFMVPIVLTITLIYGRGNLRTFAIGALFPAGLMLFTAAIAFTQLFFDIFSRGSSRLNFSSISSETTPYVTIYLVCSTIVIVVMGVLAVGARSLIEAEQRPGQPKTPDHDQVPEPTDADDRGNDF